MANRIQESGEDRYDGQGEEGHKKFPKESARSIKPVVILTTCSKSMQPSSTLLGKGLGMSFNSH